MNSVRNQSRLLGVAFLLQFVTSFLSGLFLQPALFVAGDIEQTLANIAANPGLMRTYILVDTLTAMGIIFLGVMLYIMLRKQNELVAGVALGFYVLEAALLASSKLAAYWLLRLSETYGSAAVLPDYVRTGGTLALESMEFVGVALHLLVFCVGALLFYWLLYQSRLIPRVLSLWGLVALVPLFVGTVAAIYGYETSVLLYVAYVPFEFVVGLWILVKGAERPQPIALVPSGGTATH